MKITKNTYLLGVVALLATASGVCYGFFGMGDFQNSTVTKVNYIVAPMDADVMIQESDAVILGTVTGNSVLREPSLIRSGETDVVTSSSIKVEEYLSNPEGIDLPAIEVRTLGGTIGKETVEVEDSSHLKVGSRVVLFIYRNADGNYWVASGPQGKYTLNEDGSLGSGVEKNYVRSVFGDEMISLTDLRSIIAEVQK